MTTSPAEVDMTSRGSAVAQRVLAGASIAGVVGGMIAFGVSGEPWWAILLWDLAMLFVALIMLAIWVSAGQSAKETAALLATGKKVLGEVTDKSVHDDGETVYRELTVWIPLAGGGFEGHHRCHHAACRDREPGTQVIVLVDPVTSAWAVLH